MRFANIDHALVEISHIQARLRHVPARRRSPLSDVLVRAKIDAMNQDLDAAAEAAGNVLAEVRRVERATH